MFDPISQDPPHDADFPASMSDFAMPHQGALLNGVIYHPVGEGAHPLILLLHGLPGHERNLDLAQILRRAGWTVCVFHYRGSWGSGGAYRFAHVLDDVKAALDYFRDASNAEKYRIDPERIMTIGHSLGGWASLLMAASGAVDRAVSIAGVNIGVWGAQLLENPDFVRPMLLSLIENSLAPLHGAKADDIVNEVEANANHWDTLQKIDSLKAKRLLLIGAKRDAIVPVFDHHMPLVKALKDAGAENLSAKLIAADHSFSGNRIELAQAILDWLE